MAWEDLNQGDRLRCPHCREWLDLKVESKVRVAVREPFQLPKPAKRKPRPRR